MGELFWEVLQKARGINYEPGNQTEGRWGRDEKSRSAQMNVCGRAGPSTADASTLIHAEDRQQRQEEG